MIRGVICAVMAACVVAAGPSTTSSPPLSLKSATIIPPNIAQQYQLTYNTAQARQGANTSTGAATHTSQSVAPATRDSRHLFKLLFNGLDSREHHKHGSGSMVAHHKFDIFGKKIKAVTALSYGKPYYHEVIEVPHHHHHHESGEHHHHHSHERPEHHHHSRESGEHHHHHHHSHERPEHHHHHSHERPEHHHHSRESGEHHHHHSHERPEHHHHSRESGEHHHHHSHERPEHHHHSRESGEHHHHHHHSHERPEHHHESSEHYYYHHYERPEHHRHESSENHYVRVKPDYSSAPGKEGGRPRPLLLATSANSEASNSFTASEYSDESFEYGSKGGKSSSHIHSSGDKSASNSNHKNTKVHAHSSKSTSNDKSTYSIKPQRKPVKKQEYSAIFRKKPAANKNSLTLKKKPDDRYFGWMRNALKEVLEQDSEEIEDVNREKGVLGEKRREIEKFGERRGSVGGKDKKSQSVEVKKDRISVHDKVKVKQGSVKVKAPFRRPYVELELEPSRRKTKERTFSDVKIDVTAPKKLSEDSIRKLSSISKLTISKL